MDGLRDPELPFTGIFIRAPVVLTISPSSTDPPMIIVARLAPHLLPEALQASHSDDDPKTVVALRQGLHLLTTFHPELTKDDRFHDYFVRECVIPNAP